MEAIGKVRDITTKFEFEWSIENFFALPLEDEKYQRSPLFFIAGEYWYLRIYPNGQSKHNRAGYVGLYLYRKEPGPPINLTGTLCLRTYGKKKHEAQFTCVFEKAGGCGTPNFLSRSRLSKKKLELLPSGTLTIVCSVEHFVKPIDDDADKKETAKCSHCKGSFVPSHEQKCPDKPTCADVGVLKKCFDHEFEKSRVKATEKLVDDLANIFCNEEHSDVTFKVKDEVFRLHRCILAGRNTYFNSMFKTEMKEKITGIVTTDDDCEPDVFRSFIHFVYTGKVDDDLSLESVCDIYKVADKYQEDQLKEECLCFMNNKMSVETFCDFAVLALKYNEKELLQNATDLFCRKIKEIIQSVQWQNFMIEYPTEANEFHIKAVNYYAK